MTQKQYRKIFLVLFLLFFAVCPAQGEAKAVTTVTKKQNISMARLTVSLQKQISAMTKEEPASSDLVNLQKATRIATRRLPQGYTSDGTYYYYLSQLSNVGSHKNDLRLTRVRYKGLGCYRESYMTLKGFGHGTNLDCVSSDGITYLWTGSDQKEKRGGTMRISCFRFERGTTLYRHANISYRIPVDGKENRYGANCYPAVSSDGTVLAVRFTSEGGQQFQFYTLKNGTQINPRDVEKTVRRSATPGDFQGFDIWGSTIYTLEGSARRTEMRELGKVSAYRPMILRTYNYKSGQASVREIEGAMELSHREPEGIQVKADGTVELMIASHFKDLYTCANIYRVK